MMGFHSGSPRASSCPFVRSELLQTSGPSNAFTAWIGWSVDCAYTSPDRCSQTPTPTVRNSTKTLIEKTRIRNACRKRIVFLHLGKASSTVNFFAYAVTAKHEACSLEHAASPCDLQELIPPCL